MVPGMNLIFHTSVAKWLKQKIRKVWGLIPTMEEVTVEPTGKRHFFCPAQSWIGLRIPLVFVNKSSENVLSSQKFFCKRVQKLVLER